MQKIIEFKKRDSRKQLAVGIVYQPLVADSQGDFMTREGIEKAAHDFLQSGRTRSVDTDHDGVENGSFIAESFIADGSDPAFPEGAWVVGVKVPDASLWDRIEKGALTGLSLLGRGVRKAAKLGGKAANLIDGLTVEAISLVNRAANGTTFAMLKADNHAAAFQSITDSIECMNSALGRLYTMLEVESQPRNRTNLSKAEAELIAKYAAEERSLEERQAALHDRLEVLWDRPDCPNYVRKEAAIRDQIEDVEMELRILRKGRGTNFLDERCAFFSRGGSSNFLREGPVADDSFGVATRLTKADEDSVDLDCLTLGGKR